MKVTASRLLQEKGEARVHEIVSDMGHAWREAGREPFGLDGFIEVVKFREPTGQLIGVQVKSGRSFLGNQKKRSDDKSTRMPMRLRQIRLKADHLEYFRKCRFPVLIVWFDPVSDNAFWGQVGNNALLTRIRVPNVFNKFSFRQIDRIAARWYSEYPAFKNPPLSYVPIKDIKTHAREFYDKFRTSGCFAPAFGEYVHFTLRGWKHLISKNKSIQKISHNLFLIKTAIEIIERQEIYHVCRSYNKGEQTHTLYKQSARISYSHRADGVVHVITERIGHRELQFLSVYEDRLRESGRPGRRL